MFRISLYILADSFLCAAFCAVDEDCIVILVEDLWVVASLEVIARH